MDKIEKHCRDVFSSNGPYKLPNEIKNKLEGIIDYYIFYLN